MKKTFLIPFLLVCSSWVKAQKSDTTVYYGCRIKNDTTTYIGQKTNKVLDCNTFSWPKFPKGEKEFHHFLAKNLRWPKTDLDVQGKVFISFVVEKNGTLTHLTIERSLSNLFDKEALRVIKLSPRWIPAKASGKPIRCKFFIPVDFRMSD